MSSTTFDGPVLGFIPVESKVEEYVPKREAYKFGFYQFAPSWTSYDSRPRKITAFEFAIKSMFKFAYTVNPFNGYLTRKNKWFRQDYLSDFIYNPYELKDILLRNELGFPERTPHAH